MLTRAKQNWRGYSTSYLGF